VNRHSSPEVSLGGRFRVALGRRVDGRFAPALRSAAGFAAAFFFVA
jgi:hypothetical protein